jgi:hypothetical protein
MLSAHVSHWTTTKIIIFLISPIFLIDRSLSLETVEYHGIF